jgi:hypothetical protein
MAMDDTKRGGFSLKRWSQRKLAAARAAPAPEPVPAPAATPLPSVPVASVPELPVADAAALPAVESLTIDSDFRAFLQPKVDEALKRRALRQLFRDPHFNVMDGLDVYIGDYSIPDPIAPEIVREMVQGRYIFDPPKVRVNEDGVAEDVPASEPDAVPEAAPPELPAASPTAAMPEAAPADATEPAPAIATPPDGPAPASR